MARGQQFTRTEWHHQCRHLEAERDLLQDYLAMESVGYKSLLDSMITNSDSAYITDTLTTGIDSLFFFRTDDLF